MCLCSRKLGSTKTSAPKDNAGNLLNMLNVGTGKEITIKELSEKIAEIIDYQGYILG